MHQEVGTLAVRVVGDDDSVSLAAVHLFQNLQRLGSRGSAHVQHKVVLVHVQKHGGKHADRLLATDVSRQREGDHVLVQLLEGLDLPQLLAVHIDLC